MIQCHLNRAALYPSLIPIQIPSAIFSPLWPSRCNKVIRFAFHKSYRRSFLHTTTSSTSGKIQVYFFEQRRLTRQRLSPLHTHQLPPS
jgi:hypothetical protein